MTNSICGPPVKYVVSSPHRDIILDEAADKTALICTRSDAAGVSSETDEKDLPGLTYGIYLRLIKKFIARDSYRLLIEAVSTRADRTIRLKDIDEIVIRSEKHGSVYHVARIDVVVEGNAIRFAANVAFSAEGKRCMDRELGVLRHLRSRYPFSFLPHLYFAGKEEYRTEKSAGETALISLGKWFAGYHEFHLSEDETGPGQNLIVWDYDNGFKSLSDKQGREIYRQAAKILSLYYDIDTFGQIYPWHHASGDFIVRADPCDGATDIKLITVRGYAPLIDFSTHNQSNRLAALLHFFSGLSIRMRLDRFDGTGEIAWADDRYVDGIMEGFFDALKIKENAGEYGQSKAGEFIEILRSLNADDWTDVLIESLDIYNENDPHLPVILHHLSDHAKMLRSAVQKLAAIT
ncbi:MAG: hypothetical protein BAW33_00900 [Desulfobacterales bacterium C00003104]|nr:MAG: hypothetical protein BAW33_00900 [Desulfobacterales bacterium C00003104]